MKLITKIGSALAAIIATNTLFAAPPAPYGWYVEGNVGYSKNSNISYGPGSSITTNNIGFNLNGGYKFSNYFAAELGYTKYANTIISNAATNTNAATAKYYGIDAAAKGILPVSDVELFAKIGADLLNSNVSITNTAAASTLSPIKTGKNNQVAFYFGLGADYAYWSCMPINIQWMRAVGNSNVGNLDLLSIGIAYIFE